ncbi:DUF1499 domain-containing protein [Calothrix sp. NIES-3974]|uniref:DUF1499 domain-containing protein n=1 Tax=Calothrix sp. NIES-3974 TaxID=2005462 RepID=UPI000BBBFA16|nr:DUF1499 domain-containing protein [Calothrix sp. NIES-3974]
MLRFIIIIFAIFLCWTGYLIPDSLTNAIAAETSQNQPFLSACPRTPNCVVSQGADSQHAIDPIPYHVSREQARETLLKVVSVVPRTEVIEKTDNYIHATSKSRIFKFVDDVEFYLPENENVIHVRSASRVGESDLGVNRRRVEQIRLALQDLGIS